jgi:hypothetical protein
MGERFQYLTFSYRILLCREVTHPKLYLDEHVFMLPKSRVQIQLSFQPNFDRDAASQYELH